MIRLYICSKIDNIVREGEYVMEDWNLSSTKTQSNSNELSPQYIESIHKTRRELQRGIQLGDMEIVNKAGKIMSQILRDDELNILKRVPDKVRAYKNILLSLNTLYSCEAEIGGLSPWHTHTLSEKYAVKIEEAENNSLLDEIHSEMINGYADTTIRKTKSDNLGVVEKAEQYIETNFTEDISMEEMANKLFVHPSHLMRVFKKEKGMTISKYRNLRRIKEAKQLILSSNLSITKIAITVGFNNPQYFSTLFKEVEGITPVEFKKMQKNK